jgi:co-chaperonin GroES (HSP10)
MSKMPDYLLGGRVIVKPLERQEEVSNDVIIPKTANSNLSEGLVVKVDEQINKWVKVGEIVVFPTGNGIAQLIDGVPHLWLEVNQLWAGFSMDEENVKPL